MSAHAAHDTATDPAPQRGTQVARIKRRADFLAARDALKAPSRSLVVQARRRGDGRDARFGFTVSRKVGNAVERNRVRRRLREAVRLRGADLARSDFDYVVIGRKNALTVPFESIVSDLESALRRIHRASTENTVDRTNG